MPYRPQFTIELTDLVRSAIQQGRASGLSEEILKILNDKTRRAFLLGLPPWRLEAAEEGHIPLKMNECDEAILIAMRYGVRRHNIPSPYELPSEKTRSPKSTEQDIPAPCATGIRYHFPTAPANL